MGEKEENGGGGEERRDKVRGGSGKGGMVGGRKFEN